MLYSEPESSTIEFKERLPEHNQISKSIIGFCNQHGGKLIIGVKDNGEIIGLPEDSIDSVMTKVSQIIHNDCHPPIIPLVYTRRIDEKIIVIIEVVAGLYKPYFLKSKGLSEGTFIRLGPSTIKANPEMIQELQWQSHGQTSDQMPLYQSSLNDLALEEFLKIASKDKTDEEQNISLLKGYGLVIQEHKQIYPTVAGVLLFAKKPQHFISEAFIICTHFQGNEGRNVIATRDCTGTLFEQLDDAYAWILSRLNKKFTITKVKRDEYFELPENAVRETLINAVVHRNYQLRAPTKIAIYDNRIEIFSPGNFPGPLKISELEYGFTYMRNPNICRLFRKNGLMEKLGSGFTILFSEYRKANLPKPIVVEGTGYVKCILPRPGVKTDTVITKNKKEDQVLNLLAMNLDIDSSDVEQQLKISKTSAIRLLNSMIEQGTIERVGSGPSTRYKRI